MPFRHHGIFDKVKISRQQRLRTVCRGPRTPNQSSRELGGHSNPPVFGLNAQYPLCTPVQRLKHVRPRRFPVYILAMETGEKKRGRPITYWIGEGAGWLLKHVVSGLAATGVTPNMFTFLGLAVNTWAAALFAFGHFRQAVAVLFLAGFLDMADGQVARRVGRVTAFGAFLDSTLDRYSDLALYMGLVVYYTLIGRPFYMTLAAVAMASSFMVSYSRARAESLIPTCKVGFMERPERLVLLLIGGTFNRMAQVLWVIATLSTLTVIHRVVYTWRELRAGRSLPEASASQTF
jgi:CDP-diacylglycerol--glycerol-3-phosphate 3-phosphatidyltransferase